MTTSAKVSNKTIDIVFSVRSREQSIWWLLGFKMFLNIQISNSYFIPRDVTQMGMEN